MITILFLFIIGYIVYDLYDLYTFNINGTLQEILYLNDNTIEQITKYRNPLYFTLSTDKFTLDTIRNKLPQYEIHKLNNIIETKNRFEDITEYNDLINIKELTKELTKYLIRYDKIFSKHSLTLYDKQTLTNPVKNNHKYTIFMNLGEIMNLYLINPKHKDDIITNNNPKKWSTHISMSHGNTVIVPNSWYTFIDTSDNQCIFIKIEIDTISSYIVNHLRIYS